MARVICKDFRLLLRQFKMLWDYYMCCQSFSRMHKCMEFFLQICYREISILGKPFERKYNWRACVCVCQCELTKCGCVWETKSKVSTWLFCSILNQAERLKRLLMLFSNTEQLSKLLKMRKLSASLQCDAG